MCQCNIKKLATFPVENPCSDPVGHAQAFKEALISGKILSFGSFLDCDPLTICHYLWCINEEKFKTAFSDIGMTINRREELSDLCEIAKKFNGKIPVDANNQHNFLEIISKIQYTQDEINKRSCEVAFSKYI